MRTAKLFAYLAISIFLPLWLYKFSDNELNIEREKQKSADEAKNENAKLIAAILASKQTTIEIKFNSNHLDSLVDLIVKSNNAKKNITKACQYDSKVVMEKLKMANSHAIPMYVIPAIESDWLVYLKPFEVSSNPEVKEMISGLKRIIQSPKFSSDCGGDVFRAKVTEFNYFMDAYITECNLFN